MTSFIDTDTNFSFAQIPTANQEIEVKFITPNEKSLQKMCDTMSHMDYTSTEYSRSIPHSYWDKSENGIILNSRPISCYLDDKDKTMNKMGYSLRSRFSATYNMIESKVEHCVKDEGVEINGPRGSLRHEDEIYTNEKIIDLDIFTDSKTQTMLKNIDRKSLSYYFATDVKRQMFALKQNVNGKNALFEVAFDSITYVHPDKKNGKQTEFARKLDLTSLTIEEIESALSNIEADMKSIAKKLNIELRPEERSKGQRGMYEV